MDFASNAFLMICAAMVFIMTPGLAFFYGGLGRRKNVVNNMFNSIFILGIGMVLWYAFGWNFAFGADGGPVISAGFTNLFHNGITGSDTFTEGGVATFTFSAFQMMFALITPAIITGSVAGRIKINALIPFIAIWSLLVYYPMAHMVWGGGFLADPLGSIDFAGGNVVHIASGTTGLVLAILLGKRIGYEKQEYRVHNIPFVVIGTGLLWFGWDAFNAGSAGAADGLAAHALMTTNISAATALVSWMILDMITNKKPTVVGACTGVVAGLVGITPAAGFVPLWAAFLIGLLVSPICFLGIKLVKKVFKIDDALDAFGCHGIGGIFGGLMTGLFHDGSIDGWGAANGLFFGGDLLWRQAAAILITILVVVVGTLISAGIVRIFTKLRVEKKDELVGLDITQHGEHAYPAFHGLD